MSNPQHYRLAPYFYTVFNALSFPTQEWPVEYFSNGGLKVSTWAAQAGRQAGRTGCMHAESLWWPAESAVVVCVACGSLVPVCSSLLHPVKGA
jgi:hypothetical protein